MIIKSDSLTDFPAPALVPGPAAVDARGLSRAEGAASSTPPVAKRHPEFVSPTPGPWAAECWDCHAPTTVIAQPRGKMLATTRVVAECAGPDSLTENMANARLIACAPDLLALAKQYADECAECDGTGLVTIHVPGNDTQAAWDADDQPCDACSHIHAIIDKAEGR